MKVAFTSDKEKGGQLSDHFGKAPYFQIYEVADGQGRYMETRVPEPLTKPGCNHKSAKEIMEDMDAIITSVMGKGAYHQLTKQGKDVYVVEAMSVEEGVERFVAGELVHDPSRIKKKASSHGKFLSLG